jgi:hypothetical protein
MIKLSDRHEDGSVQFWDITNISMPLIYKLKTSDYFQIEQILIIIFSSLDWSL